MRFTIKPLYLALIVIAIILGGAFIFFGSGPNFRNGEFSDNTTNLLSAKSSEIVELKNGDSYNLTASIVKSKINGNEIKMLAYNGMIPGPTIKVPQGSEITLNFTNNTDVDSTIHSHGIRVVNKFDGVPDVTQEAVKPGQSFTYKIKFPDEGVYWYHPHIREDYAQELGLYGNFLVVPPKKDYWAEVDREEMIFLDDILIENGQIAPFSRSTVDHTLMGRFGNIMLVNGSDSYKLSVKQGERVRFYVTNSANTRVFNFSIPNTRMKLVGGDSGKYEREAWVDSVILGPSERAVVEIWFNESGDYKITHKTPEKTYSMGTVAVQKYPVTTSYFLVPRVNQDFISSLSSLRPLFAKTSDKRLKLTINMGGQMQNMMQGQNTSGSDSEHGGHMMEGNQQMSNDVMMGTTSGEPIEWEDTGGAMNMMSNTSMMKWIMLDENTQKSNADINDWKFKVGDKVKISIFNDPKSMHPMQHPIHFHGQRFLVLSSDGVPNSNLVWKDTVLVKSGERVEILLDITNPGDWVAHCHIPEHMEAGMMFEYKVI